MGQNLTRWPETSKTATSTTDPKLVTMDRGQNGIVNPRPATASQAREPDSPPGISGKTPRFRCRICGNFTPDLLLAARAIPPRAQEHAPHTHRHCSRWVGLFGPLNAPLSYSAADAARTPSVATPCPQVSSRHSCSSLLLWRSGRWLRARQHFSP